MAKDFNQGAYNIAQRRAFSAGLIKKPSQFSAENMIVRTDVANPKLKSTPILTSKPMANMRTPSSNGTFGSQKTMDAIKMSQNKPKPTPVPKYMGRGTRNRLNTIAEKQMFGRKASY